MKQIDIWEMIEIFKKRKEEDGSIRNDTMQSGDTLQTT